MRSTQPGARADRQREQDHPESKHLGVGGWIDAQGRSKVALAVGSASGFLGGLSGFVRATDAVILAMFAAVLFYILVGTLRTTRGEIANRKRHYWYYGSDGEMPQGDASDGGGDGDGDD